MRLTGKLSNAPEYPHHAFVSGQVFGELSGQEEGRLLIAKVQIADAIIWCFIAASTAVDPKVIELPRGLGLEEVEPQCEAAVEIGPIDALPVAAEVIFACAANEQDFRDAQSYLQNVLAAWPLPLSTGQRITHRARTTTGIESFVCEVQRIDGSTKKQTVRIGKKATEVHMVLVSEGAKRASVGFETIGGLDWEIGVIREIVQVQFNRKADLSRLGLRPTRGILLTGPPGTGKTLIARTVAREFGLTPYLLNATELLSEYVGAGERRLREMFDRARKQGRAIIFIDEIDVLTANRDSAQEDFSRRLVNQFLPLMDGIEDAEGVTVIGATNRPHAIDPAFRRPGRFDEELKLSIPTPDALKTIFEIHTRQLDKREIDFGRVVAECAGFVGADVEAAVRSAVMHHLKSGSTRPIGTDDLLRGVRSIVPAIRRHFPGKILFPAQTAPNKGGSAGSAAQLIHRALSKGSTVGRPGIVLFDTGSLVSDQDIGAVLAQAAGLVTIQLDIGALESRNLTEALNRIAVYFRECALVLEGCHFAGVRHGISMYSSVRRILLNQCRIVVFAGTHFDDPDEWQEMADEAMELDRTGAVIKQR